MALNIKVFFPQFEEKEVVIGSNTYTALVLANLDSDGFQIENGEKTRTKFFVFISSLKGQDIDYPQSIIINGYNYDVLSVTLNADNPEIIPFYQIEILKKL